MFASLIIGCIFGFARLISSGFQAGPDGASNHAHQADSRPHLIQKIPGAHTGFAQRHTAKFPEWPNVPVTHAQ